jgi:hypothetical protein
MLRKTLLILLVLMPMASLGAQGREVAIMSACVA